MRILGVSAFYHDSAAALVEDGRIVAAAQEERFTRRKYDSSYPRNAVAYCLGGAGIGPDHVDYVAFYDKPYRKFARLLATYLAFAPRGFRSFREAMPVWLGDKLFQRRRLGAQLREAAPQFDWQRRLLFCEHHLSHAASAFFPSPFSEAAILTMDGVGEWATTSAGLGNGNRITIAKEIHFPHSLGLLYSAFTYFAGFQVNSGEYKLMGLAPYGVPRFADTIREHLIDLKADGSFRLNQTYFDYCTGLTMTNENFAELFGMAARKPQDGLEQPHMDLAASIQHVTEEAVLRLTRALAAETGMRNLCLAGGVALNCVANGKVLRDGGFDNLWIQPAAGDAGGALGAALAAYHLELGCERQPSNELDGMSGSFLGPAYDGAEIRHRLSAAGAVFAEFGDDDLIDRTARALADGKAVGWFQGRMEFGPRALGARSILGDARSPTMQRTLNLKIKYREGFRPFAPSVLRDDAADWFELDGDSPYMLLVADVAARHRRALDDAERRLSGLDMLHVARSSIPAVTNVDYSARIQTVHREINPRYHALLSRFKALTGCPVLVNTSFNVRGEPICCTPEDAFRCFMGSEIDVLVAGNCYLLKEDQNPALRLDYRDRFDPD
jgi:carbamoyltransferase